MDIGIIAEGDSKDDMVAMHFGKAPYVVIANLENNELDSIHLGHDHHNHDLGIELKKRGIDVFVAGGMGPMAAEGFVKSGVKLYQVSEKVSVEEAVNLYKKGELIEFTSSGTPGEHHLHGSDAHPAKEDKTEGCGGGHACASGVQEQELNMNELALKSNMEKVKHKLVIMSGKGGVGKSTVTLNLALSLSKAGHNVGILDADISGPNIPKMLGLENTRLTSSPAGILPVEKHGIKIMSMSFALPENDSAVIWRGPLKIGVIEQFLRDVIWADLDYLIIDLPPGTGDEAISIMQLLPEMDGVIAVTTPQEVAALDTRRSIHMARKMQVPVMGVIENMSGTVCPKCGEILEIFKSGGGEKMAENLGVPFLGKIPMDSGICDSGDSGRPFILESNSLTSKAFEEVAGKIRDITEER